MKKQLLLIFIFFISGFSKEDPLKLSSLKESENKIFSNNERNTSNEVYRNRMKDFIKEIRNNTSKNRIIITQNGNGLYFNNGKLDKNFFNITDGTTQESLYYGDILKYNTPTQKKSRQELLNLLIPLRNSGKPVFVINYAKGKSKKDFLIKEDMKTKFISEMLLSFGAKDLYESIHGYNTKNIDSLNQVKNFLCLLNPEKFKDINQYFEFLKNTDFDLLLIEPSHNGVFFTKEQIKQLKTKKSGGKRLVVAYFSIGEAEDYRNYWDTSWNKKNPEWIVAENTDWKGNYIVKYWYPKWKKIIKNYQKNLDEIGVDGYLLDTVDSYYYFEDKAEQNRKISD